MFSSGRHLHYLKLLKRESGVCARNLQYHGHFFQPITNSGVQSFIPNLFLYTEVRSDNFLKFVLIILLHYYYNIAMISFQWITNINMRWKYQSHWALTSIIFSLFKYLTWRLWFTFVKTSNNRKSENLELNWNVSNNPFAVNIALKFMHF